MERRQRTTEHPDENLLTAFAERTLAHGERERVLAHLSDCSDCRDTVFLAQQAAPEPELQAGSRLSQSEPRPSRWRWAIVSVVGLLFAVLIVAPVLLHRHANDSANTSPTQVASSEPTPAPASTGIAPLAPSSQTPAGSNASGSLRSQVTTARELTLNSRSSSVSASAQAAPPNTPAAASASKTPTLSALPADSGVLEMGAEIAGSVVDPSGAAIPGVTVSLRLPDATARQAVTDPNGRFAIDEVPPGKYVAEFDAAGFQTAVRNIDVHAQDRAALSETLVPGSASEAVNVAAASVIQLQTENAELHGTINGKAVDPLLLNGRDFSQLSKLAPAAPVQAPKAQPRSLRAVRRSATAFSIKDGVVQSCIGKACAAGALPSVAVAVSVAFDGTTALVVDANGNLFSTKDTGEHWVGTKPQWQGKAVSVRLASQASGSAKQSIGGPVVSGPISGTFAPPSIFALTNDGGQVWLSSDEGQTWHLK
jgi:hypothetical protein